MTTSIASTQASASSSAAAAVTGANTLTQLAGNFNDFLSLLTTQLKNQDPTSPMDTNQFTSQLVQFTAVAEQISTNTTLGQLLTSSLAQQLSQATGLIGTQVSFTGGTLPLQSGQAQLNFQTPGAEPVQITVSDPSGVQVAQQTVNAVAGQNSWTWNGVTDTGKQLSDGSYTVAVTAAGAAVPFQASGTVTGAEQASQSVQLQFGGAAVAYSNVVSLTGPAAAKAALPGA
jgi:flagellar basal-body rod modification protein FlgD